MQLYPLTLPLNPLLISLSAKQIPLSFTLTVFPGLEHCLFVSSALLGVIQEKSFLVGTFFSEPGISNKMTPLELVSPAQNTFQRWSLCTLEKCVMDIYHR